MNTFLKRVNFSDMYVWCNILSKKETSNVSNEIATYFEARPPPGGRPTNSSSTSRWKKKSFFWVRNIFGPKFDCKKLICNNGYKHKWLVQE